jgi:hypothetical protein
MLCTVKFATQIEQTLRCRVGRISARYLPETMAKVVPDLMKKLTPESSFYSTSAARDAVA